MGTESDRAHPHDVAEVRAGARFEQDSRGLRTAEDRSDVEGSLQREGEERSST